jgi:TolA-binding protein
MKRVNLVVMVFLLVLACLAPTKTEAFDKYYLLKKGNDARALGNKAEAIEYYAQYIQSHPFNPANGFGGPAPKNNQWYLRNLLIACENLIDVLQMSGYADQSGYWLDFAARVYEPWRFGLRNQYRLADILLNNNRVEEGFNLFESILVRHERESRPYDVKVVLRTFKKLMREYAERGMDLQAQALYIKIADYPIDDLDPIDIQALAELQLSNPEQEGDGISLLIDLVAQYGNLPPEYDHAVLRGCAGLLELSQFHGIKNDKNSSDLGALPSTNQSDETSLYKKGALAERCFAIANNKPPSRAQYRLATIFLESGYQEKGVALLSHISENYIDSHYAPKSLFVLAKQAVYQKQYSQAIQYYDTYIDRYFDNRFFALKAYSNMIDAYWLRDGDFKQQEEMITRFADIINETADFETKLNLARDLSLKGYDHLAEATFMLGYREAQRAVREIGYSTESVRLNWQISKFAQAVGMSEIAIQHGEDGIGLSRILIDSLFEKNDRHKLDYYRSRLYLVLANSYESVADIHSAVGVLQHFVNEFPGDRDISYAHYQLGRLFESDNRYIEAIAHYRQVRDSIWVAKAEEASARMIACVNGSNSCL